jgi:hypothetical protein
VAISAIVAVTVIVLACIAACAVTTVMFFINAPW